MSHLSLTLSPGPFNSIISTLSLNKPTILIQKQKTKKIFLIILQIILKFQFMNCIYIASVLAIFNS